MFNLSAIIGSAILYGDFRRASFHQIVTFLYGCAATFAGVFIIAWHNGSRNSENEDLQAEDVEATTAAREDASARDLRMGGLSRRSRATLVIPENAPVPPSGTPILRNKPSFVSMIGLSPAQVRIYFPLLDP